VLDAPARIVYNLGKNTKIREKLAKIKDPLVFTKEIIKLEMANKQKSSEAPPPERRVSGGVGGKVARKDAHLDRLRTEAERTGDMTELLRYKRNLKRA
jgi:hypothetical protein